MVQLSPHKSPPWMQSYLPGGTASSLRLCFVKASPTVEKAVSCYKANQLIASLPSFHNIQSSLAVHKFHTAGPQASVCEYLMPDVVPPKVHQKNCSYVSSADLPLVHYARIQHGGRLHGEPQKTTKWGLGGYEHLIWHTCTKRCPPGINCKVFT